MIWPWTSTPGPRPSTPPVTGGISNTAVCSLRPLAQLFPLPGSVPALHRGPAPPWPAWLVLLFRAPLTRPSLADAFLGPAQGQAPCHTSPQSLSLPIAAHITLWGRVCSSGPVSTMAGIAPVCLPLYPQQTAEFDILRVIHDYVSNKQGRPLMKGIYQGLRAPLGKTLSLEVMYP